LLDAFRAFNTSQNGLLTCSELYSALVWLGLPVEPADIHAMVRHMDRDGDGLVSFDEFRMAVGGGGELSERDGTQEMTDELEGVALRPEFQGLTAVTIPELAELDESEAIEAEETPQVPMEALSMVKVKVKKLEKFDEVWKSSGIATKHKTSIWEDRLSASRKVVGGRNRLRVCLGHYASSSYTAPRAERYTLELTDLSLNAVQQSKMLPLAVRQCFPHPLRFHRVWGIQTGTVPLFVWEPVPPDGFVALGHVATHGEEPPSVRIVHCVPRSWVAAAPEMTKMLWSDSGASGKPGSLWSAGALGLLVAAQGQQAPGDKAYRLIRTRFTLGDYAGPCLVPDGNQGGPEPPPPGRPAPLTRRRSNSE